MTGEKRFPGYFPTTTAHKNKVTFPQYLQILRFWWFADKCPCI